MRRTLYALAGALALLCLASILDDHGAFAQNAVPVMSRTKEALTCASPCSVAVDNKAVFADTSSGSGSTAVSAQRVRWVCRNVGAADAYICRGTTCSSAAYDWLLTTASKDSYGEEIGAIWAGAISASSTGTTLACAGMLR